MKKKIYLSYDLSIQGDYNNLYKWLDAHQAKECGDSVCLLLYEFAGIEKNDTDESSAEMLRVLKKDLTENISFGISDRIYMMGDLFYKTEQKLVGAWVIGSRNAKNPWDGFSNKEDEEPRVDE